MSDAKRLEDGYAMLKSGTLWSSTGRCKGYAPSNPGEAAEIDAYVAALAQGGSPAPPQLSTATGKGIVAVIAPGFAAVAPAPEPIPAPLPPAPEPTPVAGIDAFKGVCSANDADMARARDLAGAKHVRVDWPPASRVTAAKAAGIEVFPIACYAHGHGAVNHALPTDMAGWLSDLKASYAGAWQKPAAVEIWNEPWHREFMQPMPDPVAYRNLVKAAALALWEVNPSCVVVWSADNSGHTNTSGTNVWRANVLKADSEKFLAKPLMRPSTHNYCEARTPDNHYTGDGHCSWDMQRYDCAYNAVKAHGHPDPKVWVTEWGWETNDPAPSFHYFGAVTEAQQADYTVKGIRAMQASKIVERSFLYFFKAGDNWAYNMLDPSGQPRDVCTAMKTLT
jgi:hypothetical protein